MMEPVVLDYPPPPWRLAGRVVGTVAPLGVDAARRVLPAPLRLLPVWPGHVLAMLLLGLYEDGSTLRYGEVAGVVGPVLAGGRPVGVVTSIWVDEERSMAGGRELWGLPKQLATLHWRPGAVDVSDTAGAPLLRACWTERRLLVPVPAAAPFAGLLDGVARRAWLLGALRVAPIRLDLEIPQSSPLGSLGLAGRRLGFAGRLDVHTTAPRLASAPRRPG
jgi:acetoacetate decarboxylase